MKQVLLIIFAILYSLNSFAACTCTEDVQYDYIGHDDISGQTFYFDGPIQCNQWASSQCTLNGLPVPPSYQPGPPSTISPIAEGSSMNVLSEPVTAYSSQLKVGDRVFVEGHISSDNNGIRQDDPGAVGEGKIVAIQTASNHFVITFDAVEDYTNTRADSSTSSNWSPSQIAVTHGCFKTFCIGEKAYYTVTNELETIVAAFNDDNLILLGAQGWGYAAATNIAVVPSSQP